jgi:hypothetical protein
MPVWAQVLLAIAGIVVAPILAHFAAKRGAAQGIAVGLAVHGEKIRQLEDEVARMRARYHDRIAPMVTEHEMSLSLIKSKLGIH